MGEDNEKNMEQEGKFASKNLKKKTLAFAILTFKENAIHFYKKNIYFCSNESN